MEIDIEKVRAAQREYYREWRAKNPDKVRAKNLRYWQRKAEKAAEQQGKEGVADESLRE